MAKKFNVDSNVYIILYSVVMVVVVAALLAVVSLSLQGRQNDNALNEKKQQIVTALGEDPLTTDYDSIVAEAVMLDASGNPTEGDVFAALQDLKGSIAAGKFPVFKAKNGCVVIPVYGAGLWDAIWGYVALEPDMNTVKGIVLDHKGETPGLGAEIATPAHQAKYVGKTVFEGDDFVSITLKKGGANPADANYAHEVDAITGGTKTSDGVTEMIRSGLGNYLPYLKANKSNN
ncbi:FMN-binding protein [Alistipes sp. Z76]|nr:FMN-binding protein [Alistipes sp. Z76]NCE67184.1 FMN-binding protein [Muribaculaceae bacterium M3]